MTIYLGLGCNEGERRQNIATAITQLQQNGFQIEQISPLVETPALLTEQADAQWNKPFINCVVAGTTTHTPHQLLAIIAQIEAQLGRKKKGKWSPRPIDIDILFWHDLTVSSENLTIPHPAIVDRAFVLTPLSHLSATKVKTLFADTLPHPVPLWMGIFNITPDSFSDGGVWGNEEKLIAQLNHWQEENIQIVDVGAESTRPNAQAIDVTEEWQRLEPVLKMFQQQMQTDVLKPLISLDSRRVEVIKKALPYIDIVNDVSGLQDKEMLAMVRDRGCQVVAMHSTSIPADPKNTLPIDQCVITQLCDWLDRRIDAWLDAGLNIDNIVFDPGVGFGKTRHQSLQILQNISQLRTKGLRVLIGHSRKSFMNIFTQHDFSNRDIETLGVSLSLCEKGVDILRVHDPLLHVRAYRSWSHTR